jgi:hypothetical protein
VQKELGRLSTLPAVSRAIDTGEWEATFAKVKALLPVFKARKHEEQVLQSELDVLSFTLEELRGAEEPLMQQIRDKERSHGAEGFAEASIKLDTV